MSLLFCKLNNGASIFTGTFLISRDFLHIFINTCSRLPYTEAFVNESLRFSSMIINNVQRTALEDTTIGGYFVPKVNLLFNCPMLECPRKVSNDIAIL